MCWSHNLCWEQTYGSVGIWLKTKLIPFIFLWCYHGRAETWYHNVPGIWDGGVHGPESHLIGHQVDVRRAAPAVGKGVVVAGSAQTPLEYHAARAEVILHLETHITRLSLVVWLSAAATARLLPGCCSGACCSTGSRCKPRGRFQPRRGATGAAQSSAPLQNLPWFCIPTRVCPYSSRPLTTPNGGTTRDVWRPWGHLKS